jgi:dTDP-glucose pyrophosphorylase
MKKERLESRKSMSNRPVLDNSISRETFKSYYYLKEELVAFCRQVGLQTNGGKIELTNRIAHYLDTGEKLSAAQPSTRTAKAIGTSAEDNLIENNFVCSEKHRVFFKQTIGSSFSFNVLFQKWLKQNAGRTYRDAIAAYYQILEDKKKSKTTIDKQFEYNTYIRDFFADNSGKTLEEAIRCWKFKKGLQGHNKYAESDLTALD